MRRVLLVVPLLASLAGIVICVLLIQSHVNVLGGALSEGFFCGGGRLDCGRLAMHPSSLLFGIPLPVWGTQYFLFVLGISIATIVHRDRERKAWAAFGGMVCTLAFVFDLYLGYLMVFQVGVWCIKCLATYALNLVLLLAYLGIDRSLALPVRWSLLLPDFRQILDSNAPGYYRNVIRLLHVAGMLLVMGAALGLTLSPFQRLLDRANQKLQGLVTGVLLRAPELDMQVFAGQPSIGPEAAPVHAAVVGDFECSYCRALARNLESMRESRPNDIRITFVNLPLQSKCNPMVTEDLHRNACWLAEAGEGLFAQGKFWPYHDLLYRDIPFAQVSRERVAREIARLGADTAAFHRSMNDGSAAEAVARDIQFCRAHGIDVTPTLVLNGYVIKGAVLPVLLARLVNVLSKDTTAEPDSGTTSPGASRP